MFGTNFDNGSNVSLLLDGKATTKIKTNSTRFVTTTELVANITIAFDAVPELYDVQVIATNGKKGIGIERFAVTGQLADIALRPSGTAPAGLYQDGSGIYDRGLFVGNPPGAFNIQPECLRQRSIDLVFPAAWAALLPPSPQISDCDEPSGGSGRRVQLHFPGLAAANCPDGSSCPIGGPHNPANGSNYGPDIFYFFHVDTNNDGTFAQPHRDDSYNVIWSDASFRVLERAPGGTPCQWHITGGTAHLWKRPAIPLDTDSAAALDVIVTRTDGVCA